MDRRRVERWIGGYEKAWRTAGTAMLAELFTPGVVYSPSPWAQPVAGLDALEQYWESERRGPDEDFAMTADVVAVEMETAVIRVSVDHRVPPQQWRDLWVVLFSPSGRCARFEEWPFAPGQPDGHQ